MLLFHITPHDLQTVEIIKNISDSFDIKIFVIGQRQFMSYFETIKLKNVFIIVYDHFNQVLLNINSLNVKYIFYSQIFSSDWSQNFINKFQISYESKDINETIQINRNFTSYTYDDKKFIHKLPITLSKGDVTIFLKNLFKTTYNVGFLENNSIITYIGNRGNQPMYMTLENTDKIDKNVDNITTKTTIDDKVKIQTDKELCHNVYKSNEPLLLKEKYNICLLGDWIESTKLVELWKRYCKKDYTWDNITIVDEFHKNIDFYLVINRPNLQDKNHIIPSNKCIVMYMEPNVNFTPWYKDFVNQFDSDSLFYNGLHKYHRNNIDWHLSKSYDDFSNNLEFMKTKGNKLSMVLSSRFDNIGHKMRLMLARMLDQSNIEVDIYGKCKELNFKNYKYELDYYKRDEAIFPYKYHFMAENNSLENYFTEKITDCILGETLCFYYGCSNLSKYIDKRAYIELPLYDFNKSCDIIYTAITNNEYEKRLPFIKAEKTKFLNMYNLMPRLQSIIKLNTEICTFILSERQENKFIPDLVKQSFKNIVVKKLENKYSIKDFIEILNYIVQNNILYSFCIINLQSITDTFYDRLCDTLSLIQHMNVTDDLIYFCNSNDNLFEMDFYISLNKAQLIMNQLSKGNDLKNILENSEIKMCNYIH